HRRAIRRRRLECRHRWQGCPMKPDLVALRGPIAAALLRSDVDEDWSRLVERPADGHVERPDVMTRDDADVRNAEVLEEAARLLGELHDRGTEPLRQLEGRRADE